jgi:16S rRNA (guanine527-N7)-methyltransferase
LSASSIRSEVVDDATLAESISAGAVALGLDLPESAVGRLVDYVRLIERWNGIYNLTAVRDAREMVHQHILDCLAAAAALLRREDVGPASRILDVGSGAGLPGLVLAIAAPTARITCVESVGKKAAFITQAAGTLDIGNVAVQRGRVEAMVGRFDVITSRAYASLKDFLRHTAHLLEPSGAWMALKGKEPVVELAELRGVSFHVEPLIVPGLSADRCVVWLKPVEASARL